MSFLPGIRSLLLVAACCGSIAAHAQVQEEDADPEPLPPAAAAPPEEAGFSAFVVGLRQRALAEGVTAATFDAVIPTLSYDPRVVTLDRRQPGTPSAAPPAFAPYRARHVDAARIGRGQRAWLNARPSLARIETETGVPEAIMVAIWGHETDYGGYTGNFDLPRSLATLAFEGRRRELFTTEFIDTLKMIDRGVRRDQLKGSWAGATGYPQFLPSVYLRLARDGNGDGKVDIWNNADDALASIGNYLVNAGWKPDVRWGTAVMVPPDFDRGAVATRLVSPRCPRVFARHSRWLTVAEWKAKGLTQAGGPWPADEEMATLIEPDGPGQTAYLLTTNYRAILDYNCSNYYALSVGLLADAVVN
ncbi:lytic murein transglycosylase [Sphingomonas quercus]|uniref:Lytic murein transglycosylase n=1 Tax=Sphingomonas quercus TaxID=2842451 RepID=A0ABS6BEJ4_9SPHN|nr:lytic murein transglycosylase [Sphingomonas quercus]MBU3076257.1 lytic murein transglycosylase [Sphingomonas quercus]